MQIQIQILLHYLVLWYCCDFVENIKIYDCQKHDFLFQINQFILFHFVHFTSIRVSVKFSKIETISQSKHILANKDNIIMHIISCSIEFDGN